MKITLVLIFALTISACHTPCKDTKTTTQLSVHNAHEINLKSGTLVTGWYHISEEPTDFKKILNKSDESYFIKPEPIATQSDFQEVQIYSSNSENPDDNYFGLTIQLEGDAIQRWSSATKKSINGRLGLIINDKLVAAPKVNSEVTSGMTAINRLEYSKEEIESFEAELRETSYD